MISYVYWLPISCRAELFDLLKKLSAKTDLELVRLVGALRRTLPFIGREDFFERLGSQVCLLHASCYGKKADA